MFVFGPHNYAEDSEEETETDFEDDPEALLQVNFTEIKYIYIIVSTVIKKRVV